MQENGGVFASVEAERGCARPAKVLVADFVHTVNTVNWQFRYLNVKVKVTQRYRACAECTELPQETFLVAKESVRPRCRVRPPCRRPETSADQLNMHQYELLRAQTQSGRGLVEVGARSRKLGPISLMLWSSPKPDTRATRAGHEETIATAVDRAAGAVGICRMRYVS